jgi:PPM family protein phosphatase
MPGIRVDVVGESDIGLVRERNEDALLVLDLSRSDRRETGLGLHHIEVGSNGVVLSVLDGMGGANAGDRASKMASQIFGESLLATRSDSRPGLLRTMKHAVEEANRRIREEGQGDPDLQGMGTTLTAAALLDSTLLVVHVGDSRAYLYRGNELVQVTEDQSLVQELVATGQIPQEEAPLFEHNNVILQALGVTEELRPYAAEIALQRHDVLLLCTDGLTTMVPQEEIHEVLSTKGEDLEAAARALTGLARVHGGHDNVTLVLARFEGEGLPAAAEPGPAAVQIRQLAAPPIRRQSGLSPLALVALAVLVVAAVAGAILLIGMD